MNNRQALDKAIEALEESRDLIFNVKGKQSYTPRLIKIMDNECEELALAQDLLVDMKAALQS